MSPDLAPFSIVVWMVGMMVIFPMLLPHRAILLIVLSGTLFLPEVSQAAVGLGPIKLTKYQGVCYAALLGTLIYESNRLFQFSPRWSDVPILVWCFWAFVSAMANPPPPDGSSQVRDALAQTLSYLVNWGIPYLVGRVYFSSREAMRDLMTAIVWAAALYAPFCLWEARMSPQLHASLYGFRQHDFAQTIRFGGYRPMVFMQHGLAVGFFMVVGALAAVWMRRPLALSAYLLLLVPVAVVVKSTGAIALGLIGGLVLLISKGMGTRVALLLLVAVPFAYAIARTTGVWSGRDLLSVTADLTNTDRAQSLEFRLMNEDMLIRKALQRPMFGWGGWGRARVYNESGRDISVTDGLWVIILGDRGAFGLALFGIAVLVPVIRFAVNVNPANWQTIEFAPAACCAVTLALWAIDGLFNAMPMPLYVLMAGALAQWVPNLPGNPPPGEGHPVGH